MPNFDRLPVAIETLHVELVERAWSGDFAELMAAGGSAAVSEIKGRRYWYWKPPVDAEGKRKPRYLGPDTEAVRARIQEQRDLTGVRRRRTDMVRALRAARLPTPDRMSGEILAALSAAGAFRLRAVVVGSVAFQTYGPMLGVRLPASMSRTDDLDIGQFHAIALAVDDEIDTDFLGVLRMVDRRFEAVFSPTEPRQPMRYALRIGGQEEFSVDVLCPLRGRLRDRVTALKALRSNAQVLKHLDFLLYQELNTIALHGPGIPINVPAPERFALHKLIVSELRMATDARSRRKAGKDLDQADALIRVLAEDRPADLEAAWRELRGRGPSWRTRADRAVLRLPAESRAVMEALIRRQG